MSYSRENIQPGEQVLYEARVSKIAYINAIIMFALLFAMGGICGLASTALVISDKRVFGKRGIFRRKTINLTYPMISSIRVSQGLQGRLFDYGTIVISGRDGTAVTFKGIIEPFDIKQQIEEKVEITVLGRRLSDYITPKY